MEYTCKTFVSAKKASNSNCTVRINTKKHITQRRQRLPRENVYWTFLEQNKHYLIMSISLRYKQMRNTVDNRVTFTGFVTTHRNVSHCHKMVKCLSHTKTHFNINVFDQVSHLFFVCMPGARYPRKINNTI